MVVWNRLGQAFQIGSFRAKHPTLAVVDEQLIYGWGWVEVYSFGWEKAAESLTSRQNNQDTEAIVRWRFGRVCNKALEKIGVGVPQTSEWPCMMNGKTLNFYYWVVIIIISPFYSVTYGMSL